MVVGYEHQNKPWKRKQSKLHNEILEKEKKKKFLNKSGKKGGRIRCRLRPGDRTVCKKGCHQNGLRARVSKRLKSQTGEGEKSPLCWVSMRNKGGISIGWGFGIYSIQ